MIDRIAWEDVAGAVVTEFNSSYVSVTLSDGSEALIDVDPEGIGDYDTEENWVASPCLQISVVKKQPRRKRR